jgi:hypothetical protein
MAIIIGLAGLKRSGKDASGLILNQYGFRTEKFAGALKAMLIALLTYNGRSLNDIERIIDGDMKEVPLEEFEGRSFRHAAQTLGTEWGRDLIGTGLWVNTFLRRARKYKFVVCTDVRFPNEVAAVRSEGGVVYRVEREGQSSGADLHRSETEILTLDVDGVITNIDGEGWQSHLQTQVENVMNKVLRERN